MLALYQADDIENAMNLFYTLLYYILILFHFTCFSCHFQSSKKESTGNGIYINEINYSKGKPNRNNTVLSFPCYNIFFCFVSISLTSMFLLSLCPSGFHYPQLLFISCLPIFVPSSPSSFRQLFPNFSLVIHAKLQDW